MTLTTNTTEVLAARSGATYLLRLKGDFSLATATLTTRSDGPGGEDSIDGATWTAPAEELVIAPAEELYLRITNASAGTSIRVTFTEVTSYSL